jgi:hypothetical protein
VKLTNLKNKMARFYGVQRGFLARAELELLGAGALTPPKIKELEAKVSELRGVVKTMRLAIDYVEAEMDSAELPLEEL